MLTTEVKRTSDKRDKSRHILWNGGLAESHTGETSGSGTCCTSGGDSKVTSGDPILS